MKVLPGGKRSPKLSWGKLISLATDASRAAGALVDGWKRGARETEHGDVAFEKQFIDERVGSLSQRLEVCENLCREEAKLLRDTLDQVRQLTVAARSSARRANVAIALSIGSLLWAASMFFPHS